MDYVFIIIAVLGVLCAAVDIVVALVLSLVKPSGKAVKPWRTVK
jgi:hypothetical protein